MKLKQQWITTLVVYYCNICLGIAIAFIAPGLIEFKDAYGTDMQTISMVLTACRYVLTGSSLAFGFIFGVLNRHATVTVLMFLVAGSLLALPHVTTLEAFGVLYGLLLLGLGGYITAQAAWVIDIWKEQAGPYIQGQHFFYAVGVFIPPALYAPFLGNADTVTTKLFLANGTDPPSGSE